ncbi:KilA-N domain-containing protein [Pseudomonas typographi]|uniref:KilA-N domain-containing protein n=1 Tax=Pseudomonas typographi TaxID=2715964 RepID=A0ABR7Z0G0_9PSED|nr:KilA-N domain-containing protein [Pseudomonas typographi]MBD1550683.1 KilA-N domain-containing protein [Pseudomonas typographi]MBD1589292.1 KilA-N domain-containing protein [Pseudomonas typographi]MBD1598969.1 KilA-N domain-containing protein [Pseudomonas typographi]
MAACDVTEHRYGGARISQRLASGYLDASAMCQAAGQKLEPWLAARSTRLRVQAMAQRWGVAGDQLVQRSVEQGRVRCWLHPALARRLAAWLSPHWAVAVEQWLAAWAAEAGPMVPPEALPRYVVAPYRLAYGYFSFHNELVLHLLGPLARDGFEWPCRRWPAAADGVAFDTWLGGRGVAVRAFSVYRHHPLAGPAFQARLYPMALYPLLREYLYGEWLAKRIAGHLAGLNPPRALPAHSWQLPWGEGG